ncbi:MAG: sensor histidine kinase [Pseudomonadota bacterium]|nr:histidine kinase [Rubrivivax sp.]MCA3257904.1 histidine kinase [Rubrivivax sp.]MCE2912622.1 histidine kinase [Rubrivivax sp.]MCZ8030471.1 histidine kinase [Rubrivivax sp.]
MGRIDLASLALAGGLAVVAAGMLSFTFVTPFRVLLGRTLCLALGLLLVYHGAQRWPERWRPRWLPRWLLTTLAVALAAPVVTFVVYVASVGGDLDLLLDSGPWIRGLTTTSLSAFAVGIVLTLAALLREREARALALELQLELERSRVERQAAEARLAQLQAQIEPHFLFNTLANVQALVESGSPRAGPLLGSLAAYLRAAMPRLHAGGPTLGEELTRVRAYLELMQMRMPDRLQWRIEADAAVEPLPFPPLALMTLVENAVRHGIDPAEDGGQVAVTAARGDDGTLRASVADTGVGLAPTAPVGTGLSNLRERLAALHGPAARLVLSEHSPRGLRAEIVLPA